MKKIGTIGPAVVGVLLMSGLAACGSDSKAASGSQEALELRVNTYLPNTHFYITKGWEPFIDSVKKGTDGKVVFEVAGQEALGPAVESLNLLRSGVAGAAETTAGYHSADLPMAQISGAYGWESGALASQAAWQMCNSEPWVSEFKKAGVVPIGCSGTPPYELFTSGKPITGIPDAFDGLKVRTVGIQSEIVKALGAEPQTIPAPELYESLDRGVVDGYLLPRVGVFPLGLEELNKYVTEGMNAFSSGFAMQLISQETWDKFTDETKKVVIQAGKELSLADGSEYDNQYTELVENGKGLLDNPPTVYKLSPEEQAAMVAASDEALDAWAGARADEGLGDQADEAVSAVRELRDLEPAPIDEWADFAY